MSHTPGRVTIDQVMNWGPCRAYPQDRLTELFNGRESMSWEDIVELNIPAEDKLWALLRKEFIPEKELHLLACDFAEKVLHISNDPRCENAIEVKRLWIEGKATDDELYVAGAAAAWAAARAAARAAAWAAAWAAARAAWAAARAAWEAAWEAREAAWADREAAGEAAREAAWKSQLAMTIEVLERLER